MERSKKLEKGKKEHVVMPPAKSETPSVKCK